MLVHAGFEMPGYYLSIRCRAALLEPAKFQLDWKGVFLPVLMVHTKTAEKTHRVEIILFWLLVYCCCLWPHLQSHRCECLQGSAIDNTDSKELDTPDPFWRPGLNIESVQAAVNNSTRGLSSTLPYDWYPIERTMVAKVAG